MTFFLRIFALFQSLRYLFYSKAELLMENMALRQQVAALKKEKPRPKLTWSDRLFWLGLHRLWKKWKEVLIVVQPETVLKWHRRGFKLNWRFISKRNRKNGKPPSNKEIIKILRQMAAENPTWGAPRIHGELVKLGFRVSERTVSRYLAKIRPQGYGSSRGKFNRWASFLKNQRKGIAAMDFFIVPTVFFKRLYCFFIIQHEQRQIIHFNVTFQPTAQWVASQLCTAFNQSHLIKFMIYDRDVIFSTLVKETLKSMGIGSRRTSYRSPWQNGIAERWIGSCRRELLDHVIILNRNHLLRLLNEYVEYYHHDRTHYHLDKDPPFGRHVLKRESDRDNLIALPRVGGLHHKYIWQSNQAA